MQSVSDFARNGHPEEETIRDEKGFFRHVKGISPCQPLHRRRTLSQCGYYRGYWRPTGSGWKGGSRLHPHGNVQHLHQSSWRIPSSDFCFFHVCHQCGWHWYKLLNVEIKFLINSTRYYFFLEAMSSWWLAHWLNVGVVVSSTGKLFIKMSRLQFRPTDIKQNASRIVDNQTEYYPSVRGHPDLHYYELVYGLFILVIVLSSLMRSFFFIKVFNIIVLCICIIIVCNLTVSHLLLHLFSRHLYAHQICFIIVYSSKFSTARWVSSIPLQSAGSLTSFHAIWTKVFKRYSLLDY